MRLIDADALKKAIPETTVDASTKYRYCVTFEREDVLAIIDAALTVDIDRPTRSQFKRVAVQLGYEPVVRCQNCARWQRYTQVNLDFGHCEKHDCVMRFDDFCSRPERRTDE